MNDQELLVKKESNRYRILKHFYDKVGHNIGHSWLKKETVIRQLFDQKEMSQEEAESAFDYLINERLLETINFDTVSITHSGAKEIETSIHNPKQATQHFSALTIRVFQVVMGNKIDNSLNQNIDGNVTGSTINLGEISGSVSNIVNRLPNSPNPDQPGIKELLIQLQAAIEEATDLSIEDKADLLEQVQALAEVKQIPEQKRKEGLVRKAKKMFEVTLKTLPDTAKIVEACSKLLPIILKALES
jgi:hypothetical protein